VYRPDPCGESPSRIAGVFYFACDMDPSGIQPFEATPTLNRCFARHAKDYAELSATPEHLKAFVEDVSLMGRTQTNYSALDLAKISTSHVHLLSEPRRWCAHATSLTWKQAPQSRLCRFEHIVSCGEAGWAPPRECLVRSCVKSYMPR